jgi:hypothetical protein
MPDQPGRIFGRPTSVAVVLTLALAACTASTSAPSAPAASATPPPPITNPTPGSTAEPTAGAIDHPTGASDIVLRLDQGGGFAPIELLASEAPTFTLYGNGVIVFQPKARTTSEPDASGVVHGVPWRTATMDEGQIQDLLTIAIGPGGLGTARDSYLAGGIADAPSTIFTLNAGGLEKTVVISALAEGGTAGPDAAARAEFFKLAERLRDFDEGGSISTDQYHADRYRGVLTERDPANGGSALTWPWPAIRPADFAQGQDGNGGASLPHRTLTQADVDALGIEGTAGGLQGVALAGPNGKAYSLIVRPLLPEEPE